MSFKKFFLIIVAIFIYSFSIAQTKSSTIEYDFKTHNKRIVGFVANIPKEFLGLNLISTSKQSFGLYFDFKIGLIQGYNTDDFYDNISVNKAENIYMDQLLKKNDSWVSINVGLTKVVLKNLVLYGGSGISFYSEYRQYKDEFEILGDNGKYWIENDDESKITLNALGGFIIQIDPKFAFQIGAESQPTGVTIGFGWFF